MFAQPIFLGYLFALAAVLYIASKPKTTKNKTKPKNRYLLNIEEELSETIGHKTQIDQQSASRGKISISYSSKDERESIISKLLKLKKN